MNLYRTDPAGDSLNEPEDGIRKVLAIDTAMTLVDAAGHIVPPATSDPLPYENPLGAFAGMTGATLDGFVLDSIADISVLDRAAPGATNRIVARMAEYWARPDARTLVVTRTDAPALSTESGSSQAANPAAPGQLKRTYRLDHGKFVLRELASTMDLRGKHGVFHLERVVRFDNVRWHIDEEREARRRARRGAGAHRASVGTGAGDVRRAMKPLLTLGDPCIVDEFGNPCQPGGEPDPGSPPPPSGPGADVVFQHGLGDNGNVWSRMVPWMQSDFVLADVLTPTLISTAHITDQAVALSSILAGTDKSDWILVGHSNGGLVARKVAQDHPSLVKGVVAISSPHQGAIIAATEQAFVVDFENQLTQFLFDHCGGVIGNTGCIAAALFGLSGGEILRQFTFDPNTPAIIDDQPFGRSAFLNQLNAVPETFTRIGIENHASQRWVEWRLIGDALCNPDNSLCGGRQLVRVMDVFTHALELCVIVSGVFLDFQTAGECLSVHNLLDGIDDAWRFATTLRQDGSDGIVQNVSQVYPRSTIEFIVEGSDSHVGEPKSNKVRPQLVQALLRAGATRR